MGRGQRSQLCLCTVVTAQEHEYENIRGHLCSIAAPHRTAKQFSWRGSHRRITACRRLLLQQLARAKAAYRRRGIQYNAPP